MASIKVTKLKQLRKEMKDIEKVKLYNGLEIEVKQYLPITKKIELATKVYSSSVDREDGLLVVNETSEQIALVHYATEYYTNIDLAEDIFESYDLLVSTGIINTVISNIGNEFEEVKAIVKNIRKKELDAYEQKGKLSYLARVIPKEIEKIKDIIENFDPEKLGFLQSALGLAGFTGAEVDGNKKL